MSSQSFSRDIKAVKRKTSRRSPAEHNRHSEDVSRGRDIPKSHKDDDEFDLRRVKKEPEEALSHGHRDGHNMRHDIHRRHRGSSSSPVHQRSHANRLSPPHRRRHDSFREQREERRRNDRRRLERRAARSHHEEQWGRHGSPTEAPSAKKEKEKPSLALSGKLTEDANTFRGVVVKYNEPPEARKPKKHWRFYPFKGETALPVLHLHRQSAFLLGRDRRVADIPIDHPSCSKQHAAFQFRLVEFTRADGRLSRRVRPYVIDLGSANGTYVNGQRIEPERYVELFEKDVVKFGFSSREYVLLHDSSDTSALQEDEGVD